ncbi:MAG: gliding motility-associated C-terminal domain-containing protein, partial [Bacteroidetes bacterium]|nr:gliding motility-associated C-terminal domain-containing protein [Bacteroidota bacterium]
EIIQLSSSSSVTVSVTATDVICPGGSDGTATATPGGGVIPYTYLWSNGQTGQTATGLSEGTAYVTITDGASCETIGSVTVGLSGASISASVVSQDVSCNGLLDGTADVSVTGGSSPYSYSWSSGQSSASVTGLESGLYSVTVEDIYGCVDTASVLITEPDAIVFGSITLTEPLCAGDANGSLSVAASGGSAPLSYSIGGAGQAVGTFSNLSADNYTITVTDAHGCSITKDTVLTGPPAVLIDNISFTAPVCAGESNGTITITAHGGTGTLNYSIGTGVQTQNTFNNVSQGTYSITVTDANGCNVAGSQVVPDGESVVVSVTPANGGVCQGNCITITASGTQNFVWSPSTGLSATTGNSVVACPTSTTSYTVTGTSTAGCWSTSSLVVNVSPPPTVTILQSDTLICPGESVNVTAYGAVDYVWSGNGVSSTSGSQIVISPPGNSSYTVTGSNSPGCSDTVYFAISVSPEISPGFSGSPLSGCEPVTSVFINQSIPSGLQASWDFGDPASGSSNTSSGQTAGHVYYAGTYSVTMTVADVNGCTAGTYISNYVNVYPMPVAEFTFSPDVGVPGTTVSFQSVSTDAVTWNWNFDDPSSGNNNLSNTETADHQFSQNGEYNVTLIVGSSISEDCVDSISHRVRIVSLQIPNVVTNNGDGINDKFHVLNLEDIQGANIAIYNRWGRKVFESSDFRGEWDPENLSDGVYYYILNVQEEESYTGTITLLTGK